jgi:hypothetical protein
MMLSKPLSSILVLLSACTTQPDPLGPQRGEVLALRQKGITLGLFATDSTLESLNYYLPMVEEIQALGATHLSVVVRWVQSQIHSSDIEPMAGITPEDAVFTKVVQRARSLGMEVMVLPTIHLSQQGKGQWRGVLKPANHTAWWKAYQDFIIHYATLAQKAEAQWMVVGSELITMEAQLQNWHALIREVGEVFTGKLTYSANWDHYEPIAFWQDLDAIGLSWYPPRYTGPHPDVVARAQCQKLSDFASVQGRPILFTEVGFPAHGNAATRPWDQQTKTKRSRPEIQAQLWHETLTHWQDCKGLDGLYAWNWFAGQSTVGRTGFGLRGQPAARVLQLWFNTGGER